MAEKNVKINVKTSTGYDTLYPKTKSEIVDFDKSNSNLSSANVEDAIKEVNTKANTATSTANTNKTNIGTLSSLTTDVKTNLVGAINEVDAHTNTAQSTANTNKTNIGTLSSLKTSVKTSIVNAINNLYDITIGKTLKTLDQVKVATQAGYYVDALAVKELNNKLYEQKVLWTGAEYMSDKQTAALSEKMSDQKHGVVLIFSFFENDSAQNYSFVHFFVPKEFLKLHFGAGSQFTMTWNSIITEKYLYFNDDSIKGAALNVNANNKRFVMRYVIGV